MKFDDILRVFMPIEDEVLNARIVLRDCVEAYRELEACDIEIWRIRWFTAVSLLRSVGHVLDKVDAERDEKMKRIVKAEFDKIKKTRPDPQIFWNFIEDERNTVIKTYDFRIGSYGATNAATTRMTVSDSETGSIAAREYEKARFGLFVFTFAGKNFRGREMHGLVAEGIEWWKKHLEKIEADYLAQ